MILLRANHELEEVFKRLIQTMKINVIWTGLFVVVDNYLILQGEVRSLFFDFENRRVVTNIIDIPVNEENVVTVGENQVLPNVLNMVLYAFGKWDTLSGLKVDKNYAELDALFTGILQEINVTPDFNEKNYRFYKKGIRLTYEDVISFAVEYTPKNESEEPVEEEESLGLWHKICWEKTLASFRQVETTAEERLSSRPGNNFYLIGYQCPVCAEKLHMVIYPVGEENVIETEEGKVRIARAYTCDQCNSFYTPRPEKLLVEGDVYELLFERDKKAYEDYLELLGKNGARTSNYKFNEFVDKKKEPAQQPQGDGNEAQTGNTDYAENTESAENIGNVKNAANTKNAKSVKNIEDIQDAKDIENMPDAECTRLAAQIEEGFFPPESVRHFEEKAGKVLRKRLKKQRETGRESKHPASGENGSSRPLDPAGASGQTISQQKAELEQTAAHQKLVEKYDAHMKVLPRMSEAQCTALTRQLKEERGLSPEEKQHYLTQVTEAKKERHFSQLKKKAEEPERKNYAQICRVMEEIEKEDLSPEQKEELLAPLAACRKKKAEEEVAQLAKGLSGKLDRRQYKALKKRMKSYPEVDITPYTKVFDEAYEKAEKQEIANLVNRSRKISREDYTDILNRLEKQDFDPVFVKPYENKILEKIGELDQKALDALLPPSDASFSDAVTAYETIENGVFLPELKADALKMLDRRLKKLKADECEQLVLKLQDIFAGKIKENARIHYYPARKILIGNADAVEKERFDTALAIFAADRSRYEEPIVLFDTSKAGDGREGVILSADHIFYGSRFDAGTIPIRAITAVSAKNGLLNRGIYISRKNGAKTRLHYVVDNGEAMAFSECLAKFIDYLKEKPESRSIPYLAKEQHEVICCLRCGYVYKGGNVCPKCGYKINN